MRISSSIAVVLAGLLMACQGQQSEPESQAVADTAADTQASDTSAAIPESDVGLAYISNQNGPVTVIDLATMKTVGSIDPGAEEPRGIGVSEDGKYLVTANRGDGSLSIVDRAQGKLIKKVPIGENPEFVRTRGNQAFVSFEPESQAGPPPKPGTPEFEALEKERESRETEPAQIAIVDLDKGEVIRNITGGIETEGIEFSADGSKILITNEADNTVSVHDIGTGEMVKSIDTAELGIRPRGIKMAPNGKQYAVTLEFGDKVLILDENFDPVKTFPTGKVPNGITYDRDGKHLYVALAHGNSMQVFDATSHELVGEVPTGERCWHFTFTPDDSQLLVTCGRSHEVVVIDVATLKVTQRIEDKELPWGIVTWPRTVGTLDTP